MAIEFALSLELELFRDKIDLTLGSLEYKLRLRIGKKIVSSGMLRRVALVRTDVSEEFSASFIRVTRIGALGTTLAVTDNRRTLRKNSASVASYS
jgi:hypothetical protein